MSRVASSPTGPVSTLAAPAGSSAVASTSASAAAATGRSCGTSDDGGGARGQHRCQRLDQGRAATAGHGPDHPDRSGRGPADVRPGHRVDGPQHPGDLVGPARVPDPAVDRGVDQLRSRIHRDPVGGGDVAGEPVAPLVEPLRDAVQHPPALVRGRGRPARQRRLRGRDRLGHLTRAGDRRVPEQRAVAACTGWSRRAPQPPPTSMRKIGDAATGRAYAGRRESGKPLSGWDVQQSGFPDTPELGTSAACASRSTGGRPHCPAATAAGTPTSPSACSAGGRSSTSGPPTPTRSCGRSTSPTCRDRAGAPDVRGPFVHGRPGAGSSTCRGAASDPTGTARCSARAKLMLDPDLLAAAAGATLTGALGLTMADGTPLCAAVAHPRSSGRSAPPDRSHRWTKRPLNSARVGTFAGASVRCGPGPEVHDSGRRTCRLAHRSGQRRRPGGPRAPPPARPAPTGSRR